MVHPITFLMNIIIIWLLHNLVEASFDLFGYLILGYLLLKLGYLLLI